MFNIIIKNNSKNIINRLYHKKINNMRIIYKNKIILIKNKIIWEIKIKTKKIKLD